MSSGGTTQQGQPGLHLDMSQQKGPGGMLGDVLSCAFLDKDQQRNETKKYLAMQIICNNLKIAVSTSAFSVKCSPRIDSQGI